MSAQTIIHPSIESMREDFQKDFLKNADAYILERNFALGRGYCSSSQADSAVLYDIIESNDCGIISLFRKEIDRLEKEDYKSNYTGLNLEQDYKSQPKKNNTHSSILYELWIAKGNSGTLEEFLTLILKDEELKLESNTW